MCAACARALHSLCLCSAVRMPSLGGSPLLSRALSRAPRSPAHSSDQRRTAPNESTIAERAGSALSGMGARPRGGCALFSSSPLLTARLGCSARCGSGRIRCDHTMASVGYRRPQGEAEGAAEQAEEAHNAAAKDASPTGEAKTSFRSSNDDNKDPIYEQLDKNTIA